MPTPAFCALDEVYSDWNFKKNNSSTSSTSSKPIQPVTEPDNEYVKAMKNSQNSQNSQNNDRHKNINSFSSSETSNDIRSFCPNCSNCLKANDSLQQKIIDQNIWPRMRWVPQYPNAYLPHDPFNRYWASNVPSNNGREDFSEGITEYFGNRNNMNMNLNIEILLQIILLILVVLFFIQLIECMSIRLKE
jgi:hypothetical protein